MKKGYVGQSRFEKGEKRGFLYMHVWDGCVCLLNVYVWRKSIICM